MEDYIAHFSGDDARTRTGALYKLWHVEIFGPYLMGESAKGGWRTRDARTNADHIVGTGVTGRASARRLARRLLGAIPENERERLSEGARARIGFDNTTA